ncbi:zinc-dependent alcohol dehydrogenase [Catalinimonas niigatensis]|uniref:zinc-dependent alcohol dehydrogenase n=1 Tax=Catalinimonas niigatensis TaxID=1397264 RepID=UPI002665DE13|nr:zinc-binding alcohol dehydrogenase [Catalinimonas niigatensis]WPP51647.1 zinc-binding alcohol dehydrogenase [Catalinimonas niigatensis]
MHNAQALWHISSHKTIIQDALDSTDGECEVKALYSLISTGTERLVANGQVPVSMNKQMSVPYMEGAFSFPIKYGYSLVGKVTEGPAALQGQLVHLLHPHQDICKVKAADLKVIPADIPAPRATLASNMETALNAVWDSEVSIGDRVLLVGFGIIGSLTARLLQSIPGVDLSIHETNPDRCNIAEKMGFHLVDGFHEYDIAFHCSGSSQGLQTCIDHVGMEGKIIELSWYGEQAVHIHLGNSFHHQRKQIISSQVSQIPGKKKVRWDYQRRKTTVMELLKNPVFDQHIGSRITFQEVPALFDQIRAGKLSALSWVIDYT